MDDRILLIRTGGTIDSVAYDDPYNPPKYVSTLKGEDSLIKDTVALLPNHENVDHFSWLQWPEDPSGKAEERFVKDSQKFTEDDIHELATIIKEDTTHRHFVITHGTDAMALNAMLLQKEMAGTDKVVAFTGAMVPLSMEDKHHSDGIDGLKFTIANLANQPAGVYLAGRDTHSQRLAFFDPAKFEKDHEASKGKAGKDGLQFTLKARE